MGYDFPIRTNGSKQMVKQAADGCEHLRLRALVDPVVHKLHTATLQYIFYVRSLKVVLPLSLRSGVFLFLEVAGGL